jgi:peptidoglycan biosynthesis protein MviN/MurJ (putative lipid II flippase)
MGLSIQGLRVQATLSLSMGNSYCLSAGVPKFRSAVTINASADLFENVDPISFAVFLLADYYRKVIIGTSVGLSTGCLLNAAIALHFCWRNRRDKKRLIANAD